jgi:eukaryotic-like serine/threonine-protein kinase
MSVTPERLSASLAGHYRIERELGAGGMATVYLAHDVRHDRQVALKVVKPEIVATVGADRFVNEIRTIAHLRHPHILPLFDSGRVDAALFYVMPYIDGESLRARLRREGQLSLAETVTILRELADALAYAHAQNVVHRDIKPDNVLLAGRHAFLADFGIARALESGASFDQTMTQASAILGTPTYMSPEQAAGSHLDHRADIYAFGVLAYEMLTGRPPFTGDTAAVVMAAHLTAPPDPLAARRPDVPPALAALVMKCLAKKPDDRWQRMDDVLLGFDTASATLPGGVQPNRQPRHFAVSAGVATIGAALLAAGGVWLLSRTQNDPPLAIGAIKHVTRDPGLELDPAISPDGRTLAFVAGPPGKRRLYVRQIEGGRAIPLTEPGVAESQRRPDWSPDGSRIVFQAGQQGFGVRPAVRAGALYTIPVLGGTPTLLLPPHGGGIAMTPAWSPDGSQIAYCSEDGIYLIPASGGSPRRVLESPRAVHSVRWSPDATRLAYVAGGADFVLGEDQLGNTETSAIHIVTVATGVNRRITDGQWLDVSPVWTRDGRGLLFVSNRRGGRDVFRQRLSASDLPEGDVARVTSGLNAHTISLSQDGKLLAYSALIFRANVWSLPIPAHDGASVTEAKPVTAGSEKTEKMVVSRDGQWLAYDSDRGGTADVWKLRLAGGEPEQVTRDKGNEFANDWSPDGQEIIFHAIRETTNRDVMTVTADGTRRSAVVATEAEEQHGSWSPDGNRIAFASGRSAGDIYNIFVVSRPGKDAPWGAPVQLTTTTGVDPKWSPDGRHIIYTRRGEVRLMSSDGRGDRVVVARSMPDQPLAQYAIWSTDGETIYFKAADSERRASIWAIPAAGGTPRLLVRFDDPSRPSLRREFATDGVRFFFTIAQDESDIWIAEMR